MTTIPPWPRGDILARLQQEFIALVDGDDSSYAKGRRAELAYCIVINEQDGRHDRITLPNSLIDDAFRVTMRRLGVPLRFINTDLVGTDTITFAFDGTSVSIYRRTQIKNTTLPVDIPTLGGTLASLKCLQPYVSEENMAGVFGVHFDYVSTGGFTSRAVHAQMLATCLLPPTTILTLLTMPSIVDDAKSIINTVTPTLNITTPTTTILRDWIPKFVTHASTWLSTNATLGGGDIHHLSDVYASDGCFNMDAHMGSGKTRSIIELLYTMPSEQRILLVVSSQSAVEHFRREVAHYVGWWEENVGVVTTRSARSSKHITIMPIHVACPTNIPEDLHLTIVDEAHTLHSTGYTLAEDKQNTSSDFRGAVLGAIKRSNKVILCTGSPVHGDECSPNRQFTVSGAECIREGYIVPIRVDLACVPADNNARLQVAANHIKKYIDDGAVRNILVRVSSVERAEVLVSKLGGVIVLRAYAEFNEHVDALKTGMLGVGAVIVAVGRLIDSANIRDLGAVWHVDPSDSYIKTVQGYARSYRRAVGKISALVIVSLFDGDRERAMQSVAMVVHGLGYDISTLSPDSGGLWPNVMPAPCVVGSGSSSSTSSNSSGGDVGVWVLERDIVDMSNLAERVKAKARIEYGVKRADDGAAEERRLAKLAAQLAWKEEQERRWHGVVDWFNEHGKLPRQVDRKGLERCLAKVLEAARMYRGRSHKYLSGLTGEDVFKNAYEVYINGKRRTPDLETNPAVQTPMLKLMIEYCLLHKEIPKKVTTSVEDGVTYNLGVAWSNALAQRGAVDKARHGYLYKHCEMFMEFYDNGNVKRRSKQCLTALLAFIKHTGKLPTAKLKSDIHGNEGGEFHIGELMSSALKSNRSTHMEDIHQQLLQISPAFVARNNKLQHKRANPPKKKQRIE